jgi:hypothetical protein
MRDLIQVGEILEEVVRRANADPRFYQPWGGRFQRRTKRKTKRANKPCIRQAENSQPLQSEQLSLFPSPASISSPVRIYKKVGIHSNQLSNFRLRPSGFLDKGPLDPN